MRLAVLLPVTSRGCHDAADVRALFRRLQRLRHSLEDDHPAAAEAAAEAEPPGTGPGSSGSSNGGGSGSADGGDSSSSSWVTADLVCVCLGIDEDDPWLMAAELPAAPAVAPPAPAVAAPAPAGPAKAADGSSSNHTTSKQLAPGQQQAVPPPPPSRTRRCFLTGAFPGLDVRLVVFTRAELERQQVG